MSKDLDEDLSVRLLADVRVIVDRRPTVDRLPSAAIVAELVDLADGRWSEWRGLQDDRMPRRLTQGGSALMLAPFGPRQSGHRVGAPLTKAKKGYRREQFEAAWASYCDGTRSNIIYLRDDWAGTRVSQLCKTLARTPTIESPGGLEQQSN